MVKGIEIGNRPLEIRNRVPWTGGYTGGVKRLYATVDPAEAQALRELLRGQGIESTVGHEDGALAFGFPTDEVPIAINVRDEDAPAAAEALARHFEQKTAEYPDPLPAEQSVPAKEESPRRFGRRLLMLLIFFFPGVLGLALSFDEPWQMALAGAAGVLSLVAFIWVVDLIAENKTGPSPETGDGPEQKSS